MHSEVASSGKGGKSQDFFQIDTMPVVFIGHGSPENGRGDTSFSNSWKQLGKLIPKPALILCISAHWVIQEGTAVTAMEKPRTIHDFYGFPEDLYRIEYPCPGSPAGAMLVQRLVQSIPVAPDSEWGVDHGSWSVLRNMYPAADIPVMQLSLNYNQPPSLLFEIGKELSPLREQGVLIMGSGNIVHNLMALDPNAEPYSWALEFDDIVKNNLVEHDVDSLVHYSRYHISALAHPTSEHYLPLLCVIGAAGNDRPEFFNESIFGGSVSMRSVVYGAGNLNL